MKRSEGEELLAAQMLRAGIAFGREHQFYPPRRWRFDFILSGNLAVEVEGGAFAGKSRHRTGTGFTADAEKYSHAAIAGWRVIRATTEQVKTGEALSWIKQALEKEVPDA